jgi:hypothetical protein
MMIFTGFSIIHACQMTLRDFKDHLNSSLFLAFFWNFQDYGADFSL